jgi:glycosyltransferase involved in cell wall biosynthesis
MGYDTETPLLSVVIPAYNEGRIIEYTISDTREALRRIGLPFEIIVVDDGSVDLTGEMARESGAKVVKFEENVGKGKALLAGFKVARGKIIVIMEADGTYNSEQIKRLIEPIRNGDADLVTGTRFAKESDVRPYSMTMLGRLANSLLSFCVRLLVGGHISDISSGFKAIRLKTLLQLELKSQGSEVDAEITVKALTKGFRIAEVPVTYRTRPHKRDILSDLREGLANYYLILRSSP